MNSLLRSALDASVAVLLAAVVGCGPNDGKKELASGQAAYETGDLVKAEKMLEKSLKCAPENVDALVSLARVKLDLGEINEAKGLIDRAAQGAGGDVDVRMLSAQIAWHLKDYAAASEAFGGLADDERLEPRFRAQALSGLGLVEMAQGNHHIARLAFLRAIRLDRREASAWYHLAILYRDAFGYHEAALEQFDVFVRLEPMADQRVQDVQRKAIPALKEMIAVADANRPGASKRDSAAAATAISKGDAAMKKRTYKTARKFYQDALAADPLSYPAALGLARAWAKADTTKAGLNKSLEAYLVACSLKPGATSTFLTAGALSLQLGLPAQAVGVYSRAVAASPTSAPALDGLITALRKTGKAKIAAAYQAYRDMVTSKTKQAPKPPAKSK